MVLIKNLKLKKKKNQGSLYIDKEQDISPNNDIQMCGLQKESIKISDRKKNDDLTIQTSNKLINDEDNFKIK